MKFLLQTINGKVTLDFVFGLERNIEYQLWKHEDIEVKYTDNLNNISSYEGYIPVGTVEFVTEFVHKFLKKDAKIRPINIPDSLKKYREGLIEISDNKFPSSGVWFVKSMETIKFHMNGLNDFSIFSDYPPGKYQLTPMINNIEAEYRCFINHGQLLDCRLYSGDCTWIPDYNLIKEMIKTYDRYNTPYTLDIFVDSCRRTQIMEIHDFWSCGLYGFEYPSLSQMFSQGFYDLL